MCTLAIATTILGNHPPENLEAIICFYGFAAQRVWFCLGMQVSGSVSVSCVSFVPWASGTPSDSLLGAKSGAECSNPNTQGHFKCLLVTLLLLPQGTSLSPTSTK